MRKSHTRARTHSRGTDKGHTHTHLHSKTGGAGWISLRGWTPSGAHAVGWVARGQRALLEADEAVGDVHSVGVDRRHADRCEVVREVSSRVELAVLGAVAAAFLSEARSSK